VDTQPKVAPLAQEAAIELAYAKYMAALAAHFPQPASPLVADSRDYLLVPEVATSAAALKPVK